MPNQAWLVAFLRVSKVEQRSQRAVYLLSDWYIYVYIVRPLYDLVH